MPELVRKGRRLYGAYYQTSTSLIYIAYRKPKDLFKDTRGEFITLTEAMQDDKACWAIDESTLREARRRGCKFIGFWMRKINWVFLAPIEYFFDPHKYFSRNYSGKGGELQRYLPIRYFKTISRRMKF